MSPKLARDETRFVRFKLKLNLSNLFIKIWQDYKLFSKPFEYFGKINMNISGSSSYEARLLIIRPAVRPKLGPNPSQQKLF